MFLVVGESLVDLIGEDLLGVPVSYDPNVRPAPMGRRAHQLHDRVSAMVGWR